MLLYTNTRNDNVVSYYYYFARGRFLASRGYVHLFIYLSFVVFVFWRTNWIGRLVGSVSIHEMNESPFQAETVPAAQSVAR